VGALADKIRRAVREERYVFGDHADQRLRNRQIASWQVVGELENGKLIQERPSATPNPVAEFEQSLADGTRIKAVWAWNSTQRRAKLVAVHFL